MHPSSPFQLTFQEALGRSRATLGPHFSTLDLALWKSAALAKSFGLETRTEFYNLFSTINLGLPNKVLN